LLKIKGIPQVAVSTPTEAGKETTMEPKIVKRDAFTVMGISKRSVPEETDYNDLWTNQYMSYHDQIQPFSTDEAYYGVSFETDEEGS